MANDAHAIRTLGEILPVTSSYVTNPRDLRSQVRDNSAKRTLAMLLKGLPDWLEDHKGIHHLADDDAASRHEWAKAILECDPHPEEQRLKALAPASTAEFPTPAKRPPFSALDCTRFDSAFHLSLPPWRESLQLALSASQASPTGHQP